MDDGQADLFADFRLVGADRLNILLIKHDVIGARGQVKHALLGPGYSVEKTESQMPRPARMRWRLVRRHILYQNSNVMNATAKFWRERVENLLDYLDELLSPHSIEGHADSDSPIAFLVAPFPRYSNTIPAASTRNKEHVMTGFASQEKAATGLPSRFFIGGFLTAVALLFLAAC